MNTNNSDFNMLAQEYRIFQTNPWARKYKTGLLKRVFECLSGCDREDRDVDYSYGFRKYVESKGMYVERSDIPYLHKDYRLATKAEIVQAQMRCSSTRNYKTYFNRQLHEIKEDRKMNAQEYLNAKSNLN